MKSAIFENINDRSNIANAYYKMLNESNEAREQEIAELTALYEDKEYPICIYEWGGADTVIDLFDEAQKYKDPSNYEVGSDDYYAALAFDRYGDDELYKKILEKDNGFFIPVEKLPYLQNGFLNTSEDLYHTLVEIGKDFEDSLHEDDFEVAIPTWAENYIVNGDDSGLSDEDKKMVDDYLNHIESRGYDISYGGGDLGFRRQPEFGPASDCTRYYLVKFRNDDEDGKTVGESVEDGWFDEYGLLIKDLPQECIEDCTVPGQDAYESCKSWVEKLDFTKGLSIPLAKGYLRASGGWEDDEIATMDDKEVAIRILWMLCNDAKEGMTPLSIDSGSLYVEESVLLESSCRKYVVILTNIKWPPSAYGETFYLPRRDSVKVDVCDGQRMEDAINDVYVEKYGTKPNGFTIARSIEVGAAKPRFETVRRRVTNESRRGKHCGARRINERERCAVPCKKNEMLGQKELDELKKKNPKLKDISEEH